jgi:hypothetical protein
MRRAAASISWRRSVSLPPPHATGTLPPVLSSPLLVSSLLFSPLLFSSLLFLFLSPSCSAYA